MLPESFLGSPWECCVCLVTGSDSKMVVSGPVPKPASQRVRRHKDVMSPTRVIRPDGKLRGPRLPNDIPWSAKTKSWWADWRRSPQAQLMEPTDWNAMFEAALIHNAIYSDPGSLSPTALVSMTKELHRILAPYGMSYGDRLKLRIRIDGVDPEDPEDVSGSPVAPVVDYAAMLKNG